MYPYESIDFERDIEDAWESVKPLYEELHTYVRRKLRELYGPEKINSAAPLPSHVLGTHKRLINTIWEILSLTFFFMDSWWNINSLKPAAF